MATATPQPDPADRPAETLCPYCGSTQPEGGLRCERCGGLFEPLSRQATQNEMGPWYVRDPDAPFAPGCSYQTLKRLVAKGRLKPDSVIRGPATRQFWARARNVQGVAHLLGECHNCHAPARASDYMCRACGAVFTASNDRQHMGLAPLRLIPGQASPEVVARLSMPDAAAKPPVTAPGQRRAAPDRSPQRPPTSPGRRSVAAPTSGTPAASPPPESRATRRLRRDVGRMRAIAIAAILIDLILVGAVIVLVVNERNPGGLASPTDDAATTAAPPSGPAEVDAPGPAAAGAEERNAYRAAAAPAEAQARVQAALQRAEELAARGTASSIEEALTLLREVKDSAPAAARPEDLDERIESLERQLDELTLRDFLPTPPPGA